MYPVAEPGCRLGPVPITSGQMSGLRPPSNLTNRKLPSCLCLVPMGQISHPATLRVYDSASVSVRTLWGILIPELGDWQGQELWARMASRSMGWGWGLWSPREAALDFCFRVYVHLCVHAQVYMCVHPFQRWDTPLTICFPLWGRLYGSPRAPR